MVRRVTQSVRTDEDEVEVDPAPKPLTGLAAFNAKRAAQAAQEKASQTKVRPLAPVTAPTSSADDEDDELDEADEADADEGADGADEAEELDEADEADADEGADEADEADEADPAVAALTGIHREIFVFGRAGDPTLAPLHPREAATARGRQLYLSRLMDACGVADDPYYDALSEPAKAWFNFNGRRYSQGHPVQEFDDMAVAKAPSLRPVILKPAERPVRVKPAREPRAPRVRKHGRTYYLQLAVAKNPNIALDDLIEVIGGGKLSRQTVQTQRNWGRGMIQVLQELGWTAPAK